MQDQFLDGTLRRGGVMQRNFTYSNFDDPELSKMEFHVTVERDEDGVWIVECPSIPGCVSQGKTKAEALENIGDAIYGCFEVRAERRMPLTVEASGSTDLRR